MPRVTRQSTDAIAAAADGGDTALAALMAPRADHLCRLGLDQLPGAQGEPRRASSSHHHQSRASPTAAWEHHQAGPSVRPLR